MKKREYPDFVIRKEVRQTTRRIEIAQMNVLQPCSLKKEEMKEKKSFSRERKKFVLFQVRFLSSRTFDERRFAKPSNKSWEIDASESKDRESRRRNRWKRIKSWRKRSIEKSSKASSKALLRQQFRLWSIATKMLRMVVLWRSQRNL